MVEQRTGNFNWQHGDTYLSPSILTAKRYSAHNRYGSEILSNALFFLKILVDMEEPTIINETYKKYPKIYSFLDIEPSPIIIKTNDISIEWLLDENGGTPSKKISKIEKQIKFSESLGLSGDKNSTIGQQTNFRLTTSIPSEKLSFYMFNVTKNEIPAPEGKLYKLLINENCA